MNVSFCFVTNQSHYMQYKKNGIKFYRMMMIVINLLNNKKKREGKK